MYDLYDYLKKVDFAGKAATSSAMLALRESMRQPEDRIFKDEKSDFYQRVRRAFYGDEHQLAVVSGANLTAYVRPPFSFGPKYQEDFNDDSRRRLSKSVAAAICGEMETKDHHAEDCVEGGIDELLRNVVTHSQPEGYAHMAGGCLAAVRTGYTMTLTVRDTGQGMEASFGKQLSALPAGQYQQEELGRVALEWALMPSVTSKAQSGTLGVNAGLGLATIDAISVCLCVASGNWAVFKTKGLPHVPEYIYRHQKFRGQEEWFRIDGPPVQGVFVEATFSLRDIDDLFRKWRDRRVYDIRLKFTKKYGETVAKLIFGGN